MAEVAVRTPDRQYLCEKISIVEQRTFDDADAATAWGDKAMQPGDVCFTWECPVGHLHCIVITAMQESLIYESELCAVLDSGAQGFIKPGVNLEDLPKL